MRKDINVSPMGGRLYIVSFPPSEIEKILGFKDGKIYHIQAKNKEEAIKKAMRRFKKGI